MIGADTHAIVTPELSLDAWECAEFLGDIRSKEFETKHSGSSSSCFLLVDPLLGDPLLQEPPPEDMPIGPLNEFRSQVWARKTWALKLPHGPGLTTEEAPYVVELSGPNDPWLSASVRWATQETVHAWFNKPELPSAHRIGGWLHSVKLGSEVADTLSELIQLRTEARTTARYLRLADRRTFSLAVHVLGYDHASQNLGMLQAWHWLDPQCAWCQLQAKQSPPVQPPADLTLPGRPRPLATFNSAQWALMMRGPATHRRLAQRIKQRLIEEGRQQLAQWHPLSAAEWDTALMHAAT